MCVNVKDTRFFVYLVIVSTSVGSFFPRLELSSMVTRTAGVHLPIGTKEATTRRRRWFSIDLQKLFQGQAQTQEHRRTCPFSCRCRAHSDETDGTGSLGLGVAWTRFLYNATSGDRTHWMSPSSDGAQVLDRLPPKTSQWRMLRTPVSILGMVHGRAQV